MANGNRITGIALATELRKLADAVESLPVAHGAFGTPWIYLNFKYGADADKQAFLEFAAAMPKPIKKVFTESELKLEYKSESLNVMAYIERNQVCELVEPAKPAVYRCVPLLSDEETDVVDALAGVPVVAIETVVVATEAELDAVPEITAEQLADALAMCSDDDQPPTSDQVSQMRSVMDNVWPEDQAESYEASQAAQPSEIQ